MSRALVVGANRGIGLALCRELAARGDEVIATCRSSSPELDALGLRVESGVDVTDDAAVADLARRLEGKPLDTVIVNAGVLGPDDLDSVDPEAVRYQFEVNSLGPLRVVKALRPNLADGSRLALITSRMGSIADNTSGAGYGYRMSKAALNAAGKSLAHDLAPAGVAVVILHPGFVRTDMTAGNGDVEPEEAARQLVARIDELSLETTGRFLHARGQELPW